MITPPIDPFLFHYCTLEYKSTYGDDPDAEYEPPLLKVPCTFQHTTFQVTFDTNKTIQVSSLFFFSGKLKAITEKSRITFDGVVYIVERCVSEYADGPDVHHYEVYCY